MTAHVRDHDSGEDYEVRCSYLIGADGGRLVAKEVGVEYVGLGVVTDTATLHVSADFSRWARDPDVLIRWLVSPQTGVSVVMVPMGPERWGPDSEEWVIHLNYPVDDPRAQSDDAGRGRRPPGPRHRRASARDPQDHALVGRRRDGVHLQRRATCSSSATPRTGTRPPAASASRARSRTCTTCAGSSPLSSRATQLPELLASYEPERRSSLEVNAQRSLENAVNQFTIVASIGVSHENTEEQNLAALRRLWSPAPEDAEHRAAVLRHIRAQSMEFSEINVELGYSYDSAAIVEDGTPAPPPLEPIRVYEPSTRPGSPLPHAWIDDEDGARRPIKDLVGAGRFLLIAGEEGESWCEAARELAASSGLPLGRASHRAPRRRPLRPAPALAAPAGDHRGGRDPRAPGPLRRLAEHGGERVAAGGALERARRDPRPPGRRRRGGVR